MVVGVVSIQLHAVLNTPLRASWEVHAAHAFDRASAVVLAVDVGVVFTVVFFVLASRLSLPGVTVLVTVVVVVTGGMG